MSEPNVVRRAPFEVQVCVPSEWTDEQAKAFADSANPCGTSSGWSLREDNDGDPVRVHCSRHEGHVHMVFEA